MADIAGILLFLSGLSCLPMKSKDIFTFRDAEKQAGPVAFSTMLKPAGSACNLDCHYCYYLDKAVQYGGRQAVMSDELLELYVKQYICANEVDTVQFCWHGGEPAERFHPRSAVRSLGHLVTFQPDDPRHQPPQLLFIVDDQNFRHVVRSFRSFGQR